MSVNVNVKTQFGAKGDNKTNDASAIQKGIDYVYSHGGGTLNFPAGTYIVNSPVRMRGLVTLLGVGGTRSIIKNPVNSTKGEDQFCIYLGNYGPSDYGGAPHYNINNVRAGDTAITLTTHSEASNFNVGTAIIIDSIDGFMSSDGVHWKPYAAFINRIKTVSASTGVITLEDAIDIDITGAQAAPSNKLASDVFICVRPTVRNMGFQSLGNWAERFGMYKGVLDGVNVITTDLLGGNGFARCTITNLTGQFSQKVVEMAMYSHDTVVNGINATFWNGKLDPANKPLLKMGENLRNCIIENFVINANQGPNYGDCIRWEHAFNNQILNGTFNAPTVQQSGVEMATSDNKAFLLNNSVSNITFNLGGADRYLDIDNETVNTNMSGNSITGNTFTGGPKKEISRFQGDVSLNTFTPNTFL